MRDTQHIPPQFNRPFVANLVAHARKGMVLSWSNVCDKGVGHVNCKSEDEVIGMIWSTFRKQQRLISRSCPVILD